MNHLGHFRLAYPNQQYMAGGFLGDFVKGRLKGNFPPEIEQGIKLHRSIDAFADSHPIQQRSCQRFDPAFRRYGSIMCDVIYDYFLANHWDSFGIDSLDAFADSAYEAVLEEAQYFPTGVITRIQKMQEFQSLQRYRSTSYIDRTLSYISERLSRDNPLGHASEQFFEHRQALEADFLEFIPEALGFAATWQEQA